MKKLMLLSILCMTAFYSSHSVGLSNEKLPNITENVDVIGITLTFYVYDENDLSPIPFATVRVKNTTNGTLTDLSGDATLYNVEVPETIVVEAIGYKSKEVHTTTGITHYDVSLEEE